MVNKIDTVIEQIKSVRVGADRPWIFNENGNLKDDILLIDTVDVLEELKPFYVEWDLDLANKIVENGKAFNTYNWECNLTNDFQYYVLDDKVLISCHLKGDIRLGYSYEFIISMKDELDDSYENFLTFLENECESTLKCFYDDEFEYDVPLIGVITVYDKNGCDVCTVCEVEMSEARKEVEKSLE